MVTGELKSKIDGLWEIFWTGGLTNPLDVIEQMTYLMFIRDLDDADNLHAKEAAMLGLSHKSIFTDEVQVGERTIAGNQLKWSVFHDFPAAKMYSIMQEWVFPFIKNLHGDKDSAYSKYMGDGVNNPYIEYRDSLSDQNPDKEKYSLILANPPFKGSLDYDIVSADLLKVCKTKKTELLFLALFVRMLKVGGRCACIVPDGVLFGSSKAHKAIRKTIVEENRLEAIISMPSGVFKPYAGVSTAILIFTKTGHGGTDNVWFYDMKADGFTLDDKRSEIKENDIPDIIERFRNLDKEVNRKRTEQSFFVTKQEIEDNGYDLSINKYKEIEYIPIEYPSSQEIMTDLRELERKIGEEMDALEQLLGL